MAILNIEDFTNENNQEVIKLRSQIEEVDTALNAAKNKLREHASEMSNVFTDLSKMEGVEDYLSELRSKYMKRYNEFKEMIDEKENILNQYKEHLETISKTPVSPERIARVMEIGEELDTHLNRINDLLEAMPNVDRI